MPSIDFGKVRQITTLQEVVDLLGITLYAVNGVRGRSLCPLRCGLDRRAGIFNLESGLWYCHRCHEGGNHLQLYALVRKLPIFDAAVQLCQRLGKEVPWVGSQREIRTRRNRKDANSAGDADEDELDS